MESARPGIPTIYRDVQFRSRLEARWAVFFDLLRWPWQYEPFDLEGWIPDFLIRGSLGPVLVEVKPVVDRPDSVLDEIDATSWAGRVLVVGCALDLSSRYSSGIGFGWCGEPAVPDRDDSEGRRFWDTATFYGRPDRIGFSGYGGGWTDWIFDMHGKEGWDDAIADVVRPLWARAGNLTQWKGKQSVTR